MWQCWVHSNQIILKGVRDAGFEAGNREGIRHVHA